MMFASLLCFGSMLFLVATGAVGIMHYFDALSQKKYRGEISEAEELYRSLISIPARPALSAILSNDPVGIRVLISTAVVLAGILTAVFVVADLLIIVLAAVLLIAIWLSL